jgi:hypothetical protein
MEGVEQQIGRPLPLPDQVDAVHPHNRAAREILCDHQGDHDPVQPDLQSGIGRRPALAHPAEWQGGTCPSFT